MWSNVPMDLDSYHRLLAGESFLAPLAPRALWKLSGPDSERYLNGQVTADMPKLTDGTATYAAVCTAKGRMEGDLSLARHGADFYMDAIPELRESLGARLDKYLIADDAQFEDLSEEWQLIHVLGTAMPSTPEGGFVIAHARFGLPGHDVWSPATSAAPKGAIVDADILETLRLEHAIPKWGTELGTTTLPPEAGPHMLAAISYTKGCYVGQETNARLKSVGHVNRSLVLLRADAATPPAPGTKLVHDGREAGTITSSSFSPRLGKGIALAYVQRQFTADGTVLMCEGRPLTVIAPLSGTKT